VFAENVEAAIPVVMNLARGIGSAVSVMAAATSTVARLVGGFDNLGMIVGGLFASKAIASVAMFGKALVGLAMTIPGLVGGLSAVTAGVKAMGLALVPNPIGIAITGIALGAALIMRYWEPIGAFFSGLWDGMKAGLEPVITAVGDFGRQASIVLGPVGALFGWVGEKVNSLMGWIGGLLPSVDSAGDSFAGVTSAGEKVGHVIGTVITGAIRAATLPFRVLESLVSGTMNVLTGAVDTFKTIFDWSPLQSIREDFGAVRDYLSTIDWSAVGSAIVGTLAAGIKGLAMAPLNAVRGITDSMGGAVSAGIDNLKSFFNFSPVEIIRKSFNEVFGFLGGIDWSGAGSAVIGTLTDGIKSAAMAPVNAVKDTLGAVRDFLPFSDAKVGPMSDLTASGRAVPETMAKGMDQGGGAVSAGVNAMKAALRFSPIDIVRKAFDEVRNFLSGIDWSRFGSAIIGTLTDGIKSVAMAPVNAVKGTLSTIRDYLPFSDAKVGPMSDLTNSGRAIPQTLAEGVEASGGFMTDRLGDVVGSAMQSLSDTIANNPITQRVQQVFEPVTSMASDLIPDSVRNFFGGGNEDSETAPPRAEGKREVERVSRSQQAGRQDKEQPTQSSGRNVSITNEINLQVSRNEKESEGDYISRLADRLMEELNDRQEGALFDG
jgi:hypothetical protein